MSIQNFSTTSQILRIVGTPFDESEVPKISNEELRNLNTIASKNKVSLLFLESLSKCMQLDSLEVEYRAMQTKYLQICKTAEHVGTVLNSENLDYAIIKTLMPFHAVPNDVDVLILGNENEFGTAVKALLNSSFVVLGEAPLEVCFHDQRDGPHYDLSIKDPYDVDIYKEVGASHVVYMDKNKLNNLVTDFALNSQKVRIMTPPAELAISIFHSIFPERMYTLMLHYQILHLLNKISDSELDIFLRIVNESKINKAVILALTITELIQQKTFGYCPQKIRQVRESLGEGKISLKSVDLPYIYPLKSILKSFWYKKYDLKFTKSLFKQTINLLRPSLATHVAAEISKRAKRDTY